MSDARDLLLRLAEAYGIQTSYQGQDGNEYSVSDQTIVTILAALGCHVEPDGAVGLENALQDRRLAPWRHVLPPTTVVRAGTGSDVAVHAPHGTPVRVIAVLEDGTGYELEQLEDFTEPREVGDQLTGRTTFRLPADLPTGWHELEAHLGEGSGRDDDGVPVTEALVVVPERLTTADTFRTTPGWGLAVQLYSTRSSRSWGLGDFHDLVDLAATCAQHGGDYVLSNPLHATLPTPPVVSSPYSPSTRRFVNPLYLRVEDVTEYASLPAADREHIESRAAQLREQNTDAEALARDPVYAAKLESLHLLHRVPLDADRSARYEAFCSEEGQGLEDFALWSALRTRFDQDDAVWSDPQLVPGGATAERYRREMVDEVDFHRWLQWLCDEQLASAQTTARTAGMRLGVMQDLAVGADRDAADAWMLQDQLVGSMSVGAPPDMYNQLGQDWSQSPWHPQQLARTGYRAYRDMLRTVLRQAGGIRVDHVLGLFRLWWVPVGGPPTEGAYVTYDHEAMIGILVLEAERAGAVVVGEDLGTFEPWIQDYLASRGLLGTSILWFEQREDGPLDPADYRVQCLASVNTHDLPPTAGYLAGTHLELRERLGLLTGDAQAERQNSDRELRAYLQAVQQAGLLDAEADLESVEPAEFIEALYRYLAQAPSMLQGVALVDAVGEKRIQNQPGTTQDQYPNWKVPLADVAGNAVLIDELESVDGFARLLDAVEETMHGAQHGARPGAADTRRS